MPRAFGLQSKLLLDAATKKADSQGSKKNDTAEGKEDAASVGCEHVIGTKSLEELCNMCEVIGGGGVLGAPGGGVPVGESRAGCPFALSKALTEVRSGLEAGKQIGNAAEEIGAVRELRFRLCSA